MEAYGLEISFLYFPLLILDFLLKTLNLTFVSSLFYLAYRKEKDSFFLFLGRKNLHCLFLRQIGAVPFLKIFNTVFCVLHKQLNKAETII